MPYRSHPYPKGTASLPTFDVIRSYQVRHAEKYVDHIRLNRVITRVRHNPVSGKKWAVEWTPSWSSGLPDVGQVYQETFDYVVVANGTDSRPYIPYIDGLWDWKGRILHSRWYRRPEDFAGKVNRTWLGSA